MAGLSVESVVDPTRTFNGAFVMPSSSWIMRFGLSKLDEQQHSDQDNHSRTQNEQYLRPRPALVPFKTPHDISQGLHDPDLCNSTKKASNVI